MPSLSVLPGGAATRIRPAGLGAGAPLARVDGPAQALDLVAADLAGAEHVLRELVISDVAAVPAVAGYLAEAGGKRLRPALTALGARAIGVERDVTRLMCVGELLHLGSLLHDDVVDDGDLRRDRPAAHRVYGNAVTVLTGDFCLARAVLLAAEEGGFEAVRALGEVVTEMAEGEVLQLQRAGNLACTEEQYLDVVARKSAALIAWCVSAPALAWRPEHAEPLARFGRAVGIAFQITDDVLDFATTTGKTRGADLRDRKVTLPVSIALRRLPWLAAELADGAPDGERLDRLLSEITLSGALEAALQRARDHVATALAALEDVPDGPGRSALAVLARHLVERVR
jgi:octaprenyl-diphosphate synthase